MRKIDADAIDLTHYEGADIYTLRDLLADEPTVGGDICAKWIVDDDVFGYICSNCMREADDCYDFCPNCGAKMDEKE